MIMILIILKMKTKLDTLKIIRAINNQRREIDLKTNILKNRIMDMFRKTILSMILRNMFLKIMLCMSKKEKTTKMLNNLQKNL